MAVLGRDAILAVDDLRRQTVSVPEWGGEVIVRSMTGTERDELEGIIASQANSASASARLRNFRALTVSLCAVDESGNRLFTLEDVEALGKKSVAGLQRVFAAAQVVSAMTENDVEELVKN
jgi:hypothetical protein